MADIEGVVAWTVIRAARQAARLLTAALKSHGLTPVEFGVLAQLAAADGAMTQAEVARLTEIRPQSVSPVIDDLDRRGLLVREGVRGRGRSGRLVLTADGDALLAAAFPDVTETSGAFAEDASGVDAVNGELLTFLSRSRDV